VGRRIGELARGLGALLFLAALLIGVPVGLVAFVGWPLPDTLPTLTELAERSRTGVPDEVIVNTLAVLGWLAWAQLAAVVLLEAVALLRNVRAPSLPGIPGIQVGVARLLATAALLLGGLTNRSAPAPLADVTAASMPAAPISLVVDPPPTTMPAASPTPRSEPAPAVAPERGIGPTYTVQRHDSWWGVAEDVLGDGTRWRELRDLNVGASMPDGHVITATTDSMNEGWTIRLPAGVQPPPSAPPITPEDVVVERGDNLWDLAEEHLETAMASEATDAQIAPYWQDVIDSNRPGLADPDIIHPGQVIHLPGRGDPTPPAPTEPAPTPTPDPPASEPAIPLPPDPSPPTSTEPVQAPTLPTTTSVQLGEDDPGAQPEPEDLEDAEELPVQTYGVLGAAGTLLAAGLAAGVIRRRRRRELRLPHGAIAPDPPGELDDLRADIVRQADLDHVDVLAQVSATVARALAEHRSAARLRLVQASKQRVDVLLSDPVSPAPDGWQAEASGNAWVLDASSPPEALRATSEPTNPLLVSLGRPDSSGQLYLDLEAEGLVNVAGDSNDVAGFVRSIIHELAMSPLADTANVFVLGDPPGVPAGDLERVYRFENWDRVADTVLAWAHQTRNLLAERRCATPAAARALGEQLDDLAPMIVVLDHEPDDDRFDALCTTIGEAIVPVVVLGIGTRIDGATDIEMADGRLTIPRLNLSCEVQQISNHAGKQIGTLLEDAASVPEQLQFAAEPEEVNEVEGGGPEPYEDPPIDVLVRVLGEIEVCGAAQSLTPMQTSVLVYLALHSPVASETIQDAIWTMPTENRKKRLANTISEIRPALGPDQLPPASDGKYRLGDRVKTDLELFDARLAHAATEDREAALQTLRGALELVTGPVFTYRNSERTSYVWIDHENWISATELKVTCAAERLAGLYLDGGDHEGAVWAASVGLRAAPTHSRLTDLLMRAHHAAGDRRAIDQVFASHVNALQKLDIDDVDPDLADTYDDLRGGRRAGTG
jgi:nucleoid-associated protein YgaU/DNA-binding SARP family transcriptional activator